VNDAGVGAELRHFPGRPVIEADPGCNQKIAFVERHVRVPGGVHSKHP